MAETSENSTEVSATVAKDEDSVDLAALRAFGVPPATDSSPTSSETPQPTESSAALSATPPDPKEDEAADGEAAAPYDDPKPKHTHLQETKEVINVESTDQTETIPLAAASWDDLNLHEDILKGIRSKGFPRPSRVQASALPLLLKGDRDMIAQARNGSGKTAAFALAMLAAVDQHDPHAQCLCICPTRELAQQNLAVIRELGAFTKITSMVVVPQCERYPKTEGRQIICGTPGKLREFLQKRFIPTKSMKMFVLDEADVMVDREQNMAPQVQDIRRFFDRRMQLVLFSATYPDEVRRFAEQMCSKPYKITVKREKLTLTTISQFYVECEQNDKYRAIDTLYSSMTIGSSVIFVNSRQMAFSLAKRLNEDGHGVSLICGSQAPGPEKMEHAHRERVMKEFREGTTKVLIATDVLARGIDVPQVTLVVNYDLPTGMQHGRWGGPQVNMETYMHRVGRTGRFGQKGIAISLVSPQQVPQLNEIKKFYSCEINALPLDPEMIQQMVSKLR